MRLIILFLLVFFTACNSTTDKRISKVKEDELRTHIVEKMKNIDSTVVIDSVRFIRLDTVSQKQMYLSMQDRAVSDMRDLTNEAERDLVEYKSNIQMARLTYDLSSSLYRNSKEDADQNMDDIKTKTAEAARISKIVDSLSKLESNADSIAPVAFLALCLVQMRSKDQTVDRDTFRIVLSTDYNIVDRKKFFKYE